MLKNYLAIALRNIRKHKAYSFINISGLAIGLACFLLIMLYVQDELSFDRYHENADNIYRIAVDIQANEGLQQNAQTPPVWPTYLLADHPEIVNAVRFKPPRQKWMVNYGTRHFTEKGWTFADSSVFDVFNFPLVQGNPKSALTVPFTVVLSEAMAKKYFGDEDPMGKIITIDNQYDFAITGIMKNMPVNSHFHADFFASFVSMEDPQILYLVNVLQAQFPFAYTYLQLAENTPPEVIEAKFPEFIEKHVPAQFRQGNTKINIYLQPLTDIHLKSNLQNEIEANGDISTIYIFSAVAIFTLLIACINFMNLATARSSNRAKEIGMRKVVGALRRHLTQQFFGESILLTFISLFIALCLIYFALPFFNSMTGKQITLLEHINPTFILAIIGITLATGVLSGSYPAIFLSAFPPITILRGFSKSGTRSHSLIRKGLIVFQFGISIVLIISTAIVYNQMDYIRNKKLGFDKEHVVVIQLTDPTPATLYSTYKDVILREPNVIKVSASMSVPAGLINNANVYKYGQSQDESWVVQAYFSDFDFIETLGMELAAGRDFSREFGADSLNSLIINETAAKSFGWHNYDDAIGQQLQFVGNNGNPRQIIGVVRDFHSQSVREKIAPTIIGWANFRFFAFVRISPNDIPGTIASLRQHWESIIPGYTFDYSFLDDDFDKLYRLEDVLGKLLGNFALIAVFIACLGLFGLASFTAEQKTKEIGVRKVMGASVGQIVFLFSKEFTKLVVLAFLLASPLAYFAMDNWLNGFAYGIDISLKTFLYVGVLAIFIAMLTVSYQSIRAATANPIKSLRYE